MRAGRRRKSESGKRMVLMTRACRRAHHVGVCRAARVALPAPADGIYAVPRRPVPLEPLLSPPPLRFGCSDRGAASATRPRPGQSGIFLGVQRGAPPRAPPPTEVASRGQVATLSARSATQRPSGTARSDRSASRMTPRGDAFGAAGLHGAGMQRRRISSGRSIWRACNSGPAGFSPARCAV